MTDVDVFELPEMRKALASHSIATVYRLLQRYGASQRRIAAATGQSQSEISEILSGRRVVAYDVLVRIASGLYVPRGYLGLAYDESSGPYAPAPPPPEPVLPRYPRQLPIAATPCPSCGYYCGLGGGAVVVDGRVDADVQASGTGANERHVSAAAAFGPVKPHTGK